MNEDKIIQIIPAPANMLYAFEDGKTYPVACLALVAIGAANMWAAIFADVGVMVLAVLNAIRALKL